MYKVAQLQGIIPLSGTKNEEHMKQDVAVENLPLQGEGIENLLKVATEFITEWYELINPREIYTWKVPDLNITSLEVLYSYLYRETVTKAYPNVVGDRV